MNTMSETLGNSGAPIEAVLSDGRTVIVSLLDQAAKTKIEQHLKGAARAQFLEDRSEMTDEEFERGYSAFLQCVASSKFKFGGSVFVDFMRSNAGGMFLMKMLSKWKDTGKELTDIDVLAIVQNERDKAAMTLAAQQAAAESFPKATAPRPGRGTSGPAGSTPPLTNTAV